MSTLPLELYKPIVDELECRNDFLVLARTSKAFWSEVISKLYDTVTLGDDITMRLFLSTYRANPALAQLVRNLSVRTTWLQFWSHSIELAKCINDMTCLKQLSINYPNAISISPSIPQLSTTSSPWTSELHLPHIHSLRINLDPFVSPFKLFGTLPRPLPKLTTSRSVTLEALTDVTTVFCTGTYQCPEAKQLVHLRHLNSYRCLNAPSYFMPNLESLILGNDMAQFSFKAFINAGPFQVSLRMIGPITFEKKGEVDIIGLSVSHMTNLRVVLLRVSPQLSNDLIISHFATACPLLEHAIVLVEAKYNWGIEGLAHYKRNNVNPAESWILDHIIKDRHVLKNWADWALDFLRGIPDTAR